MDRETAHAIRSLVMRAVARSSSDQGETQLAELTLAEGVERSAVEVLQPFGLASRAPAGGAAVVLAVGGDTGDLVLLPIASPGFRLGGLAEGEAALHGLRGNRVHCKADGSIEIHGLVRVLVKVGDMEVEISPEGLSAVLGDATIDLTAGRVAGSVGDQRVVASAAAAKLVAGGNFIAVAPGGITSSVPIVVGADPDPAS